MDRRILLVLAAGAGIGTAILLFPSREKVDADQAIGRDQPAQEDDKARVTRTDATVEKAAMVEQIEARRSTPFYQHTMQVIKFWNVAANHLKAAGDEDRYQRAFAISRALRDATRPNATVESQQAALAREGGFIAELKGLGLQGDLAKIVDYLDKAQQAAVNGEAPPTPDFTPQMPEAFSEHLQRAREGSDMEKRTVSGSKPREEEEAAGGP